MVFSIKKTPLHFSFDLRLTRALYILARRPTNSVALVLHQPHNLLVDAWELKAVVFRVVGVLKYCMLFLMAAEMLVSLMSCTKLSVSVV